MATIYEIAELSGVSKSSVSKVLNNGPNISEKTRKKVTAAIEALGYQPNVHAQNLAGRKTRLIALIIMQDVNYFFSTFFFSGVIKGISKVLSKEKYNMIFSIRTNTPRQDKNIAQDILSIPYADGYILLDVRKNDNTINLIKRIIPPKFFVVIGNWPDDPDVSFVDLDQIKAASMVTEYFILRKHRKIAMLAGPEDSYSTVDRVKGFLKTYRKWFAEEEPLILYGSYTANSGYKNTEEILRLRPETTAIFASSDILAIGCLNCLSVHGIAVPGKVSVIGFDNNEATEHLSPALTTVHLGEYNLGYRATKLLIDLIDGRKKGTVRTLLKPRLVERESVARLSKNV